MCVYYCRTYDKAVCGGRGTVKDMCYEVVRRAEPEACQCRCGLVCPSRTGEREGYCGVCVYYCRTYYLLFVVALPKKKNGARNMLEEVDWSKMGSMERRLLYKLMMMAGCSPHDASAARATAAGRRVDAPTEVRRLDVPKQTLGGWAGGFGSGIAKSISPPPNWRGGGFPTSVSSPPERASRREMREDLLEEVRQRNEQRLRSLHFSSVDSPLAPLDTEWNPLTSTPSTARAGGKRLRVPSSLTKFHLHSIRQQNKQRLAAAYVESHAIVTTESLHRTLELHARSWPQAITGPLCVCVCV